MNMKQPETIHVKKVDDLNISQFHQLSLREEDKFVTCDEDGFIDLSTTVPYTEDEIEDLEDDYEILIH